MLDDREIREMRKDKTRMDKNSKDVKKNAIIERKGIVNGKALRSANPLLECTHLLEVVTKKGECNQPLPENVQRIAKAISMTRNNLANLKGRRVS